MTYKHGILFLCVVVLHSNVHHSIYDGLLTVVRPLESTVSYKSLITKNIESAHHQPVPYTAGMSSTMACGVCAALKAE